MESSQLLFRTLGASQVIFLCLYFAYYQQNAMGRLIAVNALCVCAYLLAPLSEPWFYYPPLHQLLIFFASLIPATIWLLGHRAFSDQTKPPLAFWLITSLYLVLWIPNYSNQSFIGQAEIADFLFGLLPQVIKLLLVLHVVVMALQDREADLIQSRYELRVPIALFSASLVSIVVVVEIWAANRTLLLVEAVWSVLIFIIALGSNLKFFRLVQTQTAEQAIDEASSDIKRPDQNVTKQKPVAINQKIYDQVLDQMAQRFYARHGVKLSDLAAEIAVPSHQLRPVINQQMKFQNFNQFLNHYRIQEASRRLLQEATLPILSIALDVGFKSLSTFNKAFKETHGKTPSEFREPQPLL